VASDVLILIEVSDSSLSKDIQVKLPIYARAGIGELWIADVEHDEITRHGLPANAAYTQSMVYRRGASFTSVALPKLRLAVDDILPS
jgi:Uma2 family endonuclease